MSQSSEDDLPVGPLEKSCLFFGLLAGAGYGFKETGGGGALGGALLGFFVGGVASMLIRGFLEGIGCRVSGGAKLPNVWPGVWVILFIAVVVVVVGVVVVVEYAYGR